MKMILIKLKYEMGYSIDLPTCCAAMSELIMCVPYHSRALSFSHNKRWIWRTLSLVLSLYCGVSLFMSCLFTLFSLSGPSLSLSLEKTMIRYCLLLHYTIVPRFSLPLFLTTHFQLCYFFFHGPEFLTFLLDTQR
jgi:hypothetical protein